MSNKEFETKVLSALENLNKKIDWVESNLTTKIDWVESNLTSKIEKIDEKMDMQTIELKNEMRQNTAYLNQAFVNISRIDQERFMEKNNVNYA